MKVGQHGPDFLIIGAQRSGTTWTNRVLKQHPAIWVPPVKELHYFDKPNCSRTWLDSRERQRVRPKSFDRWHLRYLFGRRSPEWYLRLFEDARAQGFIVGEATPTYAILQPEIFAEIEKVTPGSGGEIQITDAMIALSKYQPFHGVRFKGTTYDCGDKVGFLAANVAYGLEREDLGPAFREALEEIIAKHGGFLSWHGNSELAKVLQEIKAGAEAGEGLGGTDVRQFGGLPEGALRRGRHDQRCDRRAGQVLRGSRNRGQCSGQAS